MFSGVPILHPSFDSFLPSPFQKGPDMAKIIAPAKKNATYSTQVESTKKNATDSTQVESTKKKYHRRSIEELKAEAKARLEALEARANRIPGEKSPSHYPRTALSILRTGIKHSSHLWTDEQKNTIMTTIDTLDKMFKRYAQ
jgi:hypothetical protein